MKLLLLPCLLGACAILEPVASSGVTDAGFIRVSPGQVQWRERPGWLGVQSAVIAGDPSKAGIYVERVKFPPYVMSRPHTHRHDRHVTVLKGTWYTGTGSAWDPKQAVPLEPGSYMMHPAGAVHWDGSAGSEEVIIQVVGLGPSDATLADPSQPLWGGVDR